MLKDQPDRRQEHLLLDFADEDIQLKPERLLVKVGVLGAVGQVEGGRNRGEELGAGESETGLELGEIASGHLVHLLGVVLLLQHRVEGLVDALRVQHQADGQQRVHLVRLLVDLVVLVRLGLEISKSAHQIHLNDHFLQACYAS